MASFFSATTLWFYDGSEKSKYEAGIGWPADAVEVSDEDVLAFTQPAPAGYVLGADASGKAAWTVKPEPAQAELVSQSEARKTAFRLEADAAIAPLQDAVEMDIATDEEAAQLAAWKKYRVLLNRVDTSKAPDNEWPQKPE